PFVGGGTGRFDARTRGCSQELLQLLALDGFVLEQSLHQAIQFGAMLLKERAGFVEALLKDRASLFLDRVNGSVAHATLRGDALAQKGMLGFVLAINRAELLAHAVVGHHFRSYLRGLLQVVLRTGRDLSEDQPFCGIPAHEHANPRLELWFYHQVPFFAWRLLSHSKRHTARNDGDSMQGL